MKPKVITYLGRVDPYSSYKQFEISSIPDTRMTFGDQVWFGTVNGVTVAEVYEGIDDDIKEGLIELFGFTEAMKIIQKC